MDNLNKIWRWIKSIARPSNRDIKIVILCIIGATIIWFLSALNENYTTVIKCPIELDYNKEGTIEVINPPRNVQVNVSGVGWDLLKQTLSFRQDPLRIPVENPLETKQIASYTIQPLIAQHIGSLNLNFIVTDTLNFDIQSLISKRLMVYVDSTNISLRDSYQIVSSIAIRPDSVTITGHESLVSSLSDTLSIQLPQNEISGDFSEKIYIDNFDLSLVSFSPSEIDIRFDVERFVNINTELGIEMVNFPPGSSIEVQPEKANVDFRILENRRNSYPETDFLIIVDYNNVNQQDSTIRVELISYPDYVRDIQLNTSNVKVAYQK